MIAIEGEKIKSMSDLKIMFLENLLLVSLM